MTSKENMKTCGQETTQHPNHEANDERPDKYVRVVDSVRQKAERKKPRRAILIPAMKKKPSVKASLEMRGRGGLRGRVGPRIATGCCHTNLKPQMNQSAAGPSETVCPVEASPEFAKFAEMALKPKRSVKERLSLWRLSIKDRLGLRSGGGLRGRLGPRNATGRCHTESRGGVWRSGRSVKLTREQLDTELDDYMANHSTH